MQNIKLIPKNHENYFFREAFNTLRTNIFFSGRDIKTIVVTSCYAHEGKSTVSYETACNLAESGKRVLLIDADLRKSVLATRLTETTGMKGLSQVLSGQVSEEEGVCHTDIEGLDIVFAGPFPPNPTELIGSSAFKELLENQRDNYDYILIDAAPLGLVIDAAVIASFCDGAILVVNAGQVKRKTAQTVKSQLEKSGCRILGVVLNQTGKTQKKKHSDQYSYYSEYKADK